MSKYITLSLKMFNCLSLPAGFGSLKSSTISEKFEKAFLPALELLPWGTIVL